MYEILFALMWKTRFRSRSKYFQYRLLCGTNLRLALRVLDSKNDLSSEVKLLNPRCTHKPTARCYLMHPQRTVRHVLE